MAVPIAALLTDFGYRDPYVAMMKGVLLGINPSLQLVDITHDITPQRVREAALVLSASYRFFPPGTIFVVVVDPGVGGTRRALIAEIPHFTFLAPDNGVLDLVLEEGETCRVMHVTNETYFRPQVSRTFHGRDIFAPVAAWLSRGVDPSVLGPPIADYVGLSLPRPRVLPDGSLAGEVMYEDRFGNLITNLSEAWVGQQWGPGPWGGVTGQLDRHLVSGLNDYYAQRPPGAVGMIFDSWGFLEVFVYQGHAGRMLGAGEGTPVRVWQT